MKQQIQQKVSRDKGNIFVPKCSRKILWKRFKAKS